MRSGAVRQRGLPEVLVGLFEGGRLLQHVLVQLGVVDGDGGVARQRSEKLDFVAVELALPLGMEGKDAQLFPLGRQRDSEKAENSFLEEKLPVFTAAVGQDVPAHQRSFRLKSGPRESAPSAARSQLLPGPA